MSVLSDFDDIAKGVEYFPFGLYMWRDDTLVQQVSELLAKYRGQCERSKEKGLTSVAFAYAQCADQLLELFPEAEYQ